MRIVQEYEMKCRFCRFNSLHVSDDIITMQATIFKFQSHWYFISYHQCQVMNWSYPTDFFCQTEWRHFFKFGDFQDKCEHLEFPLRVLDLIIASLYQLNGIAIKLTYSICLEDIRITDNILMNIVKRVFL